jgi:hypothetical protein
MENVSFKGLLLGFLAGAIATVTVHELINWILLSQGLFPRMPWSMEPVNVPFAGITIPQIASDTLWGGLWGMFFATILGNMPQGSMTLKGILLGWIGPALIGVFSIVPVLTGKFPPFFGGDINMIWPVLVILGGFGAATAWLYGFFSYCRLP